MIIHLAQLASFPLTMGTMVGFSPSDCESRTMSGSLMITDSVLNDLNIKWQCFFNMHLIYEKYVLCVFHGSPGT